MNKKTVTLAELRSALFDLENPILPVGHQAWQCRGADRARLPAEPLDQDWRELIICRKSNVTNPGASV
jgi:hypothetical protein